jgi:hypothetical protein
MTWMVASAHGISLPLCQMRSVALTIGLSPVLELSV